MARVSTPVMFATDTPVNVRPDDTAALAARPPWAQGTRPIIAVRSSRRYVPAWTGEPR